MGQANSQTGREPSAAFQQAIGAALHFLAYRARSEAEVRRRLSRRYSPEVIEKVVSTLRDTGYLDDQSFTQLWVRSREQRRPRSQRVIRQELRRLGVSEDIVREILEDFDEEASAGRAGRKLAHRLTARGYSEEKFRHLLWGHLQRRGFDRTLTAEIVNQLWLELGADGPHSQDHANDDKEQPPQAEAKGAEPPAN